MSKQYYTYVMFYHYGQTGEPVKYFQFNTPQMKENAESLGAVVLGCYLVSRASRSLMELCRKQGMWFQEADYLMARNERITALIVADFSTTPHG